MAAIIIGDDPFGHPGPFPWPMEDPTAAAAALAAMAAAEETETETAKMVAAPVEETAAAEVVTVESEAGLEATIKTGEEAVEAAEKAAEIVTRLKGALKLLKGLSSKAGDTLLLKMAIDQVPAEQRKGLAGMALMLAAMGNKLAIVAYAYVALSGGSEEGKKVAKQAQEVAKGLNEKARKLQVDTPSKVPIDKEAHEAAMKQIKQQVDSDKQRMKKITGILDEVNRLMKEHEGDKEGEEEENNY